jgi:hypothetical protein
MNECRRDFSELISPKCELALLILGAIKRTRSAVQSVSQSLGIETGL